MRAILTKLNLLLRSAFPQVTQAWRLPSLFIYLLIFLSFFPLFTPAGVIAEAQSLTTDNVSLLKLGANVAYFLGTIAITSLALFLAFTSKYRSIRAIFWVLLLLFAADASYLYLTGSYISVSEFVFLYKEMHMIGDAIFNYIRYILIAALFFTATIALGEFASKRLRNNLPRSAVIFLLLLSFALVYISLELSSGRRDLYAAQFRLPGIVAFAFANQDEPEVALRLNYSRRAEAAAPTHKAMAKYVIIIVDESIVSYSLGVNGSRYDSTPQLMQISGGKLLNLGTASSTANSSAASNYILRNNIQPGQMPDTGQVTLGAPSLFSYAKKAGYTTYLIDAQARPNLLQNYLSKFDMDAIDNYVSMYASDKRYTNDYLGLDYLKKEISKNNDKKFFFIVKQGLHFPYNARYPEESIKFTPHFSSSEFISYESAESERLINTYLNAILWNVDKYLASLLVELEPFLDDAAIIYTSDHGQSIADPSTSRPHGTPVNPPMAQFSVPLMLMGKIFTEYGPFEKDCYSAYQIGPTALKLFGYTGHAQDLFDGCPRERPVFAGNNPFDPGAKKYLFGTDKAAEASWLP